MSSQVPRRGKVRILAVVGTNDYRDNAAPKADGWFLADFFFLQHIFKDLAAPEDQLWLTCVDPRSLVRKYKEYTHGNPREDHRKIVLDRDLVAKAYDSVRIAQPDTLRDTYLRILREWTGAAAQTGQHILTIILCHGSEHQNRGETNIRFVLGGTRDQNIPTTTNRLEMDTLAKSIIADSKVTVLTSACHPGACVQSPNMPNISMLAAVPPCGESRSWSLSTNRQACGGRYVSGIAETLFRLNIPDITLIHGQEDRPDHGAIAWEGPSYAALTSALHEIMEDYEPMEGLHPMTSARSDHWDAHWTQISGFRPEQIQARIDQLRSVPRSENMWDNEFATASTSLLQVGAMDHRVEYEVGKSLAKKLACQYLTSFPGMSNIAKNVVIHNECRDLLEGKDVSLSVIQHILHNLQYRLKDVMLSATKYKENLNARFLDCEQWDQYKWEKGAKDRPNGKMILNIYHNTAYGKVKRAELFVQPNNCFNYNKGAWFLAAVLAERTADPQAMDNAIQLWKTLRDEKGAIATSIRQLELSRHRKVRTVLHTVGSRVCKRVRDVSPQKQAHRHSIA